MSPTSLTTSPVWTATGWTMLHLVWVGAALGLLAACARWLLKTARPEARYSVALVCFLALAISPVFIFVKVFEPDAQPHTPRIRRVQDMKLDVSNPTASSERSLSERPARRIRLSNRKSASWGEHGSIPWSSIFPGSGWRGRSRPW